MKTFKMPERDIKRRAGQAGVSAVRDVRLCTSSCKGWMEIIPFKNSATSILHSQGNNSSSQKRSTSLPQILYNYQHRVVFRTLKYNRRGTGEYSFKRKPLELQRDNETPCLLPRYAAVICSMFTSHHALSLSKVGTGAAGRVSFKVVCCFGLWFLLI